MALLELTEDLDNGKFVADCLDIAKGSIVGDRIMLVHKTDDLAEEVKLNGNKIDSDKTYSSAEWRVGCIYTDDSRNEQVGQPYDMLSNTMHGNDVFWGVPEVKRTKIAAGEPYSADVRYQQNRYDWAARYVGGGALMVGIQSDTIDNVDVPYSDSGKYPTEIGNGKNNIARRYGWDHIRVNKVSDEWPEMGMIAVSPYTPIVRNYNTPHIDVGGYQNGVEYMTYMGKSYYNWCTNGFTAGLGIPPPGRNLQIRTPHSKTSRADAHFIQSPTVMSAIVIAMDTTANHPSISLTLKCCMWLILKATRPWSPLMIARM